VAALPKIRFVSKNHYKLAEAQAILSAVGVNVALVPTSISEIQSEDLESIVRDKVTKAFQKIGRTLFVEQTGLYLSRLNGRLPGGLTQVFWDGLQADRFCEVFGNSKENAAIARTMIGYTDGRQIHVFSGEVAGTISTTPRGPRDFQWDCIFQPIGFDQTFAELGSAKKNEISMRRKALDVFARFVASCSR
jgi:XTP/dITP diphosphohydrolase